MQLNRKIIYLLPMLQSCYNMIEDQKNFHVDTISKVFD